MSFSRFVLMFVYIVIFSACLRIQPKDAQSPTLQRTTSYATPTENILAPTVINEDIVLFEGKIIPLRIFLNSPAAKSLSPSEQFTTFRFSSLTLYSSARVFTLGQNINIKIENLYSDHAILATFPENQTAPTGKAGRSGGKITLSINSGTGSLEIQMTGENGGNGLPGKNPGPELNGASSVPEKLIYLDSADNCPCQGTQCLLYSNSNRPTIPQNGKMGSSGMPGFKGGDTGSLSYSITEASNFKISVSQNPGVGGNGGAGGQGGRGGLALKSRFAEVCNFVIPDGTPGPQGPSGYPGEPGSIEKVCESISGSQVQCH